LSHRPVRASLLFAPGLSSCETVFRQPVSNQAAARTENVAFIVAPKNTAGVRPAAGRLILLKHERQKPSGRYRTQPISLAAIPKLGLAQSWPIIPYFPRNPSTNHCMGSWIAGRTARCCQLRRRSTRGSAGRRRSVAIEPLRLGLDVQWLSKASN
jgi:hypothetical protein